MSSSLPPFSESSLAAKVKTMLLQLKSVCRGQPRPRQAAMVKVPAPAASLFRVTVSVPMVRFRSAPLDLIPESMPPTTLLVVPPFSVRSPTAERRELRGRGGC